jgi:hypothetical protein
MTGLEHQDIRRLGRQLRLEDGRQELRVLPAVTLMPELGMGAAVFCEPTKTKRTPAACSFAAKGMR